MGIVPPWTQAVEGSDGRVADEVDAAVGDLELTSREDGDQRVQRAESDGRGDRD
ncbi:hypothetical protein [Streptomyces sp. NBC_01438]|uniref:hypothetical protein n=1 Tax=Streptomyces sp. NBC_01438 TaxID=2903866 RepID=UPI00324C9822